MASKVIENWLASESSVEAKREKHRGGIGNRHLFGSDETGLDPEFLEFNHYVRIFARIESQPGDFSAPRGGIAGQETVFVPLAVALNGEMNATGLRLRETVSSPEKLSGLRGGAVCWA